ncbi:MAG TPA: class I SAM-dependent methyltransferase [Candidatus Saccharimonadaceae bacterium]|nr:class I SAM-dependent methyltransferase [Candidatus Saccharimonadaceae bacterium]
MEEKRHWDDVYSRRSPEQASWYQPHLERSLRFIEDAQLSPDAAILDVGGGASTLVDDLLDRGFRDVTVLDVSARAIASAQDRLGARASLVHWLQADITTVRLEERRVDFWHDRAVFHFLVEPEARRRYVAAVRHALRPNGHIMVATFGPGGPEKCSGLDVVRYGPDGLHGEFGPAFQKVSSCSETHTTPWGVEQEFVYCYCRLPGDASPSDARQGRPRDVT